MRVEGAIEPHCLQSRCCSARHRERVPSFDNSYVVCLETAIHNEWTKARDADAYGQSDIAFGYCD